MPKKFTEFTESINSADEDVVLIVDISADETKKHTKSNLLKEVNAEIATKADANHTHDDRYYTENEIDTTLNDYQTVDQKGAANGYAPLGADSKIPSSYIPAIALSDVFVVADITERDALTVQEGDWAIVTGENRTYIYDGTDWVVMTTGGDVLSVNGQTGAINLTTTEISEGDNLYYTDTRVNNLLDTKNYLTNVTGLVTAGSNISITGDGTVASPYVVNATGGSSLWTQSGSNIYYNTGNVGIGTTSPGAKLNVSGTPGSADGTVVIESYTSGNNAILDLMEIGNQFGTVGNNGTRLLVNGSTNNFDIQMGVGASVVNALSIARISGNVGIGTTSPTARLDISSDILRIRNPKTPASAGATGNQGDICWDSNYVYVCTSTNTWKRASLATW